LKTRNISILKRVKIWGIVLYSLLFAFKGTSAKILNSSETIFQIKSCRRSLIRFGDGEFGIFVGKDISYQKWSSDLFTAFEKIKKTYESQGNECRYLLAVPHIFFKKSGLFLLRKRVYLSSWAQAKHIFQTKFRQDIKYGDAFLFGRNNVKMYEKLWKNEENIIFVHNSKSYADWFSNYYHKTTYFIKIPEKNTYEVMDVVLNSIQECVQSNNLNTINCCIIISAGPAAKILIYELSKLGFWCLDTGHCWDSPLQID
jgi:hypothetical protein